MNTVDKIAPFSLLICCTTEADCKNLRTAFEDEYRIEEAQSSDEVFQIMRSNTIDVLLCDVNMPGYGKIMERRSSDKDLSLFPVFVITAQDDNDGQVRALDLGAEGVITTPIKPQLVCSQIKNALKNHWNRIDSLTGLYSNDTFCRESIKMIDAKPAGTYLLSCFDVDNFNAVNTQYGREAGDSVLKRIAGVVLELIRVYHGMACRMSADNFAVLLPVDTPAILPQFMMSVEDQFRAEGIHLKIQLSIGRYIIDDKSLSINDMINNSLLAKRTIKGRYNVSVANYSREIQESFMEEQRIISQMDYALAEGQFEVWLQPQYNHETGAMVGAEALTRWRCAEQDCMIRPDIFIPIFERNGFIYELDKYIWEQVCILLRRWIDEGIEALPVSVNVSRIDILQKDFFETLIGLVEKHRIPTQLLQLEITESAFSLETVRIIEMVDRLKAYGFTIEIDDFGSGYSSFNVLKDVPADVLKLDMKFLSGENSTGRGGNIIESIVRMAKWIGMQIIAEGVETMEQADFLRSIGCLWMQGYLYDRPMPVTEFEKIFRRSKKTKNVDIFETINALDSNAFWNPESIESLIFNSYVGGACVMEFTENKCEIIRANEKYREELRTELPTVELLKLDPYAFMSREDAQRIQTEVDRAKQDGLELRGEIVFSFLQTGHGHKECIRYYGRVIAKSSARSVVYFLIENITEQKQIQQKVMETTEQLQVLNEISKGILSKPDTKDAMESLLQRQLVYFDAARAYVMELNETQQTGSVSYWVCAEGVTPIMEADELLPYAEISSWIEKQSDKHIIIKDLNTLGTEESVPKQKLLAAGITSMIAVPLRRDGVLIGVLGVVEPRRALNHTVYLSALGDYVIVLLERRNLLTKIARDNESMQRMMNDTPGGFARMKLLSDGRVLPVQFNVGFCRLMGLSEKEAWELYSSDAYAGAHPDDVFEIQQALKKSLEGNDIFNARARFYHKEKGYIHVQAFYRTTVDGDGTQYINGYYADMTAEVELEERRKELLDNLPCGAAVFQLKDGVLTVRHINKQYMKLVGRYEDEMHYDNVMTAVYEEDCARVTAALKEAVTNLKEIVCDFRVVCGDGSYLPMHVVGKSEKQKDETILIYVTYTPVTEETLSINVALADQRRAEKLAKEVNEQLRFLNDISRYLLIDKDPDEAINRALHKMMEHFDGDRFYIFELDDEKQISSNTYEMCAPGITSEKGSLQEVPYRIQKYMLEEFHNGESICIEDISKMPACREEERQVYLRQGIRNVFIVPLWSDGTLIGYAGVDNPRKNTGHTDQLVAIGDYMASMLTRRNHVRRMEEDSELMRRLMNDMPGGFARMKLLPDGGAIPVFINEGFCQMFGMTCEEANAMYAGNAYAGVHPDDISALRNVAVQAINGVADSSLRLRFYHKEKGYLYVQAFYRTTTDSSGVKYINGYYADITAEMEQEELHKELLDNLPCGAIIFEVTADGGMNARHINKRYSELVGRSGNELRMKDSIQNVHPEDRERMMSTIREAIREDREMECDIRVCKGGGGYMAFHLVGRIVSRENQNTVIYTTYTLISEETRSLGVALAEQQRAEKLAQEVNGQLQFLNDASRYLLMEDNSDDAIHQTLHKMMEYFDGDRAYIFELDDEKLVSHNSYECCAFGVMSEKENLQSVPYALQQYSMTMFKNKKNICIENIDNDSQIQLSEKKLVTNQGVHSMILVPLWMGKKLIGYMGVDNPMRNITHVHHLAALGDYMSAMLQRRNNEARILSDNRMMRDLMNDMPGGFVQMKMYPDGRVVPSLINEEFCRMSGMSHEQCTLYYGQDAYTGLHTDDREMVENVMEDLITNRNTHTLRLRLANRNSGYTPMQVFYRVTDDNSGNLYLNGYYTDLTEQIALEEREMAEHDELTGLFNRTKLAHMCKGEYQTLKTCGVLFFDVNHLKIINDTQGHNAGDSLLRLVADSIRSIMNRRVHGYRYGGDEFIVVVCNGEESELISLIGLWRSRMDLLAKDRKMTATAAVGTAWSHSPLLLDDLIQRADQAMYADKQRSK